MTTNPTTPSRVIANPPRTLETHAWSWMRISALLLIPLVWIHALLQDIIVGVHRIDVNYVAERWANLGWRVFDILLLGFAFAHGMYGVRQIAYEYIHQPTARKVVSTFLFLFWLVITAIGATALIAGVNQKFPLQ
jgi:succinate dehydrogenase / fumarate reductase membrane anchor subunit